MLQSLMGSAYALPACAAGLLSPLAGRGSRNAPCQMRPVARDARNADTSLALQRRSVQRLHVLAEGAARGVAAIKHMAAAIDRKLQAVGRAEHRELINDERAAEVGCDEVARAV